MEIPEQTVRFEVHGVGSERDAADLSNTLTALSGVAHVAVSGEAVTVTYDQDYVNPTLIRRSAEAAGYPIGGHP